MRVLVAPDLYAGSLSAPQVAAAVRDGWLRSAPADDVRPCPLGDGGAGFVETLHVTLGGRLLSATVRSPLGEPVPAAVLLVEGPTGSTAYVEAAQAVGLALVAPSRLDVTRTTSAGVGELLRLALATGAHRVVVGVGDAATHDAGAGMLAALGAGSTGDPPAGGAPTGEPRAGEPRAGEPRAGEPRAGGPLAGGPLAGPLARGGGALGGVTEADLRGLPAVRAQWAGVDLVAACAHDLPLLGLHGASATDALARGAAPAVAQELERAFGHFAHTAVAALGPGAVRADLLSPSRPGAAVTRLAGLPGAGAGGGLGFALALLGARLLPGAAVVADDAGLPDRLADADLVVTGSASLDPHALHGTVTAVVARHALDAGVPTVVLAREVHVGRRELAAAGVAGAYAVAETADDLRAATADPAGTLAARAARVARTWSR